MNNTNGELPQTTIDIISLTISIILVSLIGSLIYFIYKLVYSYDCFSILPDEKNSRFTINICLFVWAIFLISLLFISILGVWLSFGIMFLSITIYICLGVIFYSLHICFITRLQNNQSNVF